LTLTRNAELKQERDKSRHFANEIVEALRGRHPYQMVYNAADEKTVEEADDKPTSGATFRIMGAHRGSMWGMSGYAALVVSTFWGVGEPTVYNLILAEHDFERLRDRLILKSLACGLEHFYLTRKVERPLRQKACPMCELLHHEYAPFVSQPGGWRRNSRQVTENQADVAMELYRACKVTEVSDVFSVN